MSDKGTINWQRFDKDDRDTYPPTCKELILIVLKDGHPRFIPKATYGLGGTFKEVKSAKREGGLMIITKSVLIEADDYDDINWAIINVPDHWTEKDPAED